MADERVIVSRIQHRRGLKQDLPQPLRPGEIGLATDSRQVYIGGDPDDPQSGQYNAISYFENTVGARDHTISIANNQIIAFTVPFIKFTRGEYNGITTAKNWQPSDARSIISPTISASYYSSADFPVFSDKLTTRNDHTVSTITVSSAQVNIIGTGSDATGNIRIGDRVSGDDIVGSNVSVTRVEADGLGGYDVTLTVAQSLSANSNIYFTPQTIVNYNNYTAIADTTFAGQQTKFAQGSFKSTDVIVHKNGTRLVPESNASMLAAPSANADYTFDGSNVSSNGEHTLTLRTRPSMSDEITVCYYSNANVINALTGTTVDGRITSGLDTLSFYTAYNISDYRQIPAENIRISETTGLGYISLQQKHIVAVADGANLSSTSDLTLGNLLTARLDWEYDTSNVEFVGTVGSSQQYEVSLANPDEDIFASISAGGVYRYNRVYLRSSVGNDYFNGRVYDVQTAPGDGTIVFNVDPTPYSVTRTAQANLASTFDYVGNGFTSNVDATQTIIKFTSDYVSGVSVNDYVRIVDPDANSELQGTVFKVASANATSFIVDIQSTIAGNTVPDFTSNVSSLYFINHGSNLANVDTSYQLYSENHGVTTAIAEVTGVTDTGGGLGTNTYSIQDISTNTFFVIDIAILDNETLKLGTSGTFLPELETSYSTITATPVLAIDLSANTTVKSAITTVSKELVDIPQISANTSVQIFPLMDFIPQTDGSLNAVYFSEKPAYTSVAVGGIEFGLFEDSVGTLAALGLEPGIYDRANNTVKAKLETWMNDIVNDRDINLFTNVFLGGDAYGVYTPSHLGQYNLTIDETYGEILFADRQEAAHFNFITNAAYSQSPYDRSEDTQDGSRGLVNLKNNLEIQTREAATVGEKTLTYTSMEAITILQSDTFDEEIFGIDASRYNSFVVDYSITESPAGGTNKYMRSGTMLISARTDFTDAANAVVFSDMFNSHWELSHSDPVVEPKFKAELSESDSRIIISMEEQFRDPDSPVTGDTVAHTLDTNLKIKYVVRRWSSTD